MKKTLLTLLLSLAFMISGAQEINSYFSPLKYRNIGPFRGGRSVTATGVVGDQLTYYMGITGGGLWKTQDAGMSWQNISDGFFKTGSVGAVSVSASNPNVIYCGMGEHAIRGVMTSYGDGVYKSTDAGKTWKHIGLEKTQQISRIVIHPTNPDVVYVAAQGVYSKANEERGIYKSVNGGETWEKVLYVNDKTGAAELSIDVNNPNVLYSAMWEHQRTPWKMISGGEGSALYKSSDAGKTWNKLENGLPKEMGKMAIAVSPANSNKVYALIESDSYTDQSGLYASEDAGKSWSQVSGDNRLTQRAWYYIEIFPDPNNENHLYIMSADAFRSTDGGKTYEEIKGTHGDFHDLWINPNNSNNMVIANDGGAAISFNHGKTWSTQDNQPTAQIYRLSADNLYPYNIYGGQQDNTSIKIASMSLGRYSIGQQDWTYAAGGESAFLAFDPDNPRYVLGGSYLGTIDVLDMESKSSTNIMAAPIQYLGREARDMKYLFNWNAPIIKSQHEPNTFYHAAQMVLKTTDMGKTWTEFSPDLTQNIDEKQGNGGGPYTNEAVGAENYGTISYLSESPHEAGVIYSASDDGFVFITRDNGKNWMNITPKNLGETLINAIDISPHDPATAYIATTKYKFNDYTPALFKTSDYGKSWKNISTGIPYGAHTRVVREDPAKKGLLYAGTELGVYISYNDGASWKPFQLNLPVTPITDLLVHQGDLIVGTSGRSIWILDDLAVVHQYKNETSGVNIYKPEPTRYGYWGSPLSGSSADFTGSDNFEGINPANGVVLYYNLPKLSKEDKVSLLIKDSSGNTVREFSSEKDADYKSHNGGGAPPKPTLTKDEGLNRFVWDTQYDFLPGIEDVYIESGFRNAKVPPGKYTMELKANGKTVSTEAEIVPNGIFEVSDQDFKEYDAFMKELSSTITEMHNKIKTLKDVQTQLEGIVKRLKSDKADQNLISRGDTLIGKINEWDENMVQRRSQAYDDVENFPNKFSAEYLFLIDQTGSSIPRVNQPNIDRKNELDVQWETYKATAENLLKNEIPAYNKALWDAGIGAINID
ncbi:BNR-Asp box repeat-containing protein [Flavobacteriaceae bacterium MAR_2010_188]|nr:BNR-Asp box repeat-containing protein [Flavobacteriaceae bacterium MAR_2010_188]